MSQTTGGPVTSGLTLPVKVIACGLGATAAGIGSCSSAKTVLLVVLLTVIATSSDAPSVPVSVHRWLIASPPGQLSGPNHERAGPGRGPRASSTPSAARVIGRSARA